ncbi:MAG TPA: cupin domain-containing protein [Opitutae bacterium]|nr:cupin domain-containing protein [Opitutae bacterium]|tara:strand:+ start:357 stop:728 length:372 start_codon:yes stop_codon:yes gene_type:complete
MDLQNSTLRPAAKPMIKNMPKAEALSLAELVDYQEGQVTSRTLAQNKHLNLTVFAFAQGEGLSTHHSTGDALVQVLDGKGILTIDGQSQEVVAGQSIVLPANIPHAVDAPEKFKMLLTVVKPA